MMFLFYFYLCGIGSISQLGCSFCKFLSCPIIACSKRINIKFRDIFIRPTAMNTDPSHLMYIT